MNEEVVLLLALVGVVLLVVITFVLLVLLKREYARHASQVRYAAGPPRWSTLQLHELARLQSKPRRLSRSHPVIRPWEASSAPSARER
jgi:hypothetical protein